MADKFIDWRHVYLLGWYDETGKGYLSTWDGDLPYVHVVVTSLAGRPMPLWRGAVPRGAEMHLVPDEVADLRQRVAYATKMGGYYALAWYLEDGFERPLPFL